MSVITVCLIFISLLGLALSVNDPDLPGRQPNLQTFECGSLVIPMDRLLQDKYYGNPIWRSEFNPRAYGLLMALLYEDIPLNWVIKTGKAHDGVDFTANVKPFWPLTGLTSGVKSFSAGPFIVDVPFSNYAKAIIQAYTAKSGNGDVKVYALNEQKTVDVIYTITKKPFIGVLNSGSQYTIQKAYMDDAGFSPNHYRIMTGAEANALTGDVCVSVCTEPHFESRSDGDFQDYPESYIFAMQEFLRSGGNFIAQCAGIDSYEQCESGECNVDEFFLTTNGLDTSFTRTLTDSTYNDYPDLAIGQYNGEFPVRATSLTGRFRLGGGSQLLPNRRFQVRRSGSGSYSTVAAGKLNEGLVGSNFFYLGGHDYSEYETGLRIYLNAVMIPAERDSSCGFDVDPCRYQDCEIFFPPDKKRAFAERLVVKIPGQPCNCVDLFDCNDLCGGPNRNCPAFDYLNEVPIPGNGILERGEECDFVLTPDNCGTDSTCATDYEPNPFFPGCRLICGNARLDSGEECDHRPNCNAVTCECDPGYEPVSGENNCRSICGNGQLNAGENCDSVDYCGSDCNCLPGYERVGTSNACQEICGNGNVDINEDCDSTVGCTSACKCGLGYEPNGSGGCNTLCGNGVLNSGEECDEPSDIHCNNCVCDDGYGVLGGDTHCTQICGNGQIDGNEQCDGGDNCNPSTCRCNPGYRTNPANTLACVIICGNGILDSGEECDNPADPNCASCQCLTGYEKNPNSPLNCRKICGNGNLDSGEQCDSVANCVSSTCQCADGYEKVGSNNQCRKICGNGIVDSGEMCDTVPNCDTSTCQCSDGYEKSGTSNSCRRKCGNGVVDDGEECDGIANCVNCLCRVPDYELFEGACRRKCGNGVVDFNELCDKLNDENCDEYCFCNSGFFSDNGNCVLEVPVCGNGQVNQGEECDGGDFCTDCKCDSGYISLNTLGCFENITIIDETAETSEETSMTEETTSGESQQESNMSEEETTEIESESEPEDTCKWAAGCDSPINNSIVVLVSIVGIIVTFVM